ncbi:hypothetical protein QW131_29065 [Roseibium salinum]|nr:hypothetical protein [Roseibium salinum]
MLLQDLKEELEDANYDVITAEKRSRGPRPAIDGKSQISSFAI